MFYRYNCLTDLDDLFTLFTGPESLVHLVEHESCLQTHVQSRNQPLVLLKDDRLDLT